MKSLKTLKTDSYPFCNEIIDRKNLGTETEAEKQIKLLLEKQRSTNLTLKDCLEPKRQFVNSCTFTPLSEFIQGPCSLEKYKFVESNEEKFQELQRCGLTRDEITLYLSSSGIDHGSRKRTYPVEPSIEAEKLKEIEEKIALHEKELESMGEFTRVKALSRHALDIERSLYAGCGRKEQLKNLVLKQNVNNLSETDPYSHVKKLSLKLVQKGHKRHKKCETPAETSSTSGGSPELEYNPSIHHVIVPLEEEEILSKRLSIEEIKKQPRFKDYESGIPSKVLYLKNLHPKVNIRELQSLFDRFVEDDDGCIDYRILSGRMKGQAFVTFPTIQAAESALQLVNGYILRDKPIVIEYGKKS